MKKLYLLTLLSLGFSNLESQNFSWAKGEGLWAYDYGMGIATDNSGNVYCTGKYEMNAVFSGNTMNCAGNHDIFVAKYDPSGGVSWINTAGGLLGDYAYGIACDGSNYVYVAGEIEGYGNLITFPGSSITLNAIGDNDIFLAKYDLSGNLIWARSAGGIYNEKALSVTYDNSGNVFICGHYTDSLTFGGTTTIYGSGSKDIFVAKYDMNGNFQWVNRAGGAGRDEAKSIKCDAAGNVYVCGFYSNGTVFGSQTLSTQSGLYYDTFIAKYSNSGSLTWVKTAGGNYDDVAWSLTMDNAGMLYITGEFNASAFFGTTQLITSGNADVFVACYDAAGNEQWAKRAGGPLIDRARGIGCDGTNIYITGQFGNAASFDSYTLNAADSSDVFFATINSSGNFIGASSVGGAPDVYEPLGYESGIAICAEASGNVYATGGLLDGGTFGSVVVPAYDRTDIFITKISQGTSVNAVTNDDESILVYPNPTKGNLTLDFEEQKTPQINICVFNCFGQIIDKRSERSPTKVNIDLSSHESGVYYIELTAENKNTIRKKIILQN